MQAHKVWRTLMLCGCLAHPCAGFGDLVAQVVRLDALREQFERFGDLGSQFERFGDFGFSSWEVWWIGCSNWEVWWAAIWGGPVPILSLRGCVTLFRWEPLARASFWRTCAPVDLRAVHQVAPSCKMLLNNWWIEFGEKTAHDFTCFGLNSTKHQILVQLAWPCSK